MTTPQVGDYVFTTKDDGRNYIVPGLFGKVISIDLLENKFLVRIWFDSDDYHTQWLTSEDFQILHDTNLAWAWMEANNMLDEEGFRHRKE